MVWFRVDDNFASHPKVLTLPRGTRRLAAIGAWTLAGSWCSRHPAQRGVVPRHLLDELGIAPRTAADLVGVGLWIAVEDGYRFHDFHDYNPTAEEVDAISKARATAGRAGGLASGRTRKERSQARSNEANAKHGAVKQTKPVPSRPVPASVLTFREDVDVELRARTTALRAVPDAAREGA